MSARDGFPICIVCEQPVIVTDPRGWLRSIAGWEEPRSGGGANKIIERELTGRFVHARCLRDRARGPSLFT